MKKVFLALFLAAFTLSVYSCRETTEETNIDEVEAEVEDAGQELEETAEEAGENIEEAGENVDEEF